MEKETNNRKLIYIASPYAGDVKKNTEFARAACRYCIEWGHTPIAVHLLYPQILNDGDPMQRALGLHLGRHVLEHCEELWMCGNDVSPGMNAELEMAESLGIPVRYFSRNQILDAPPPVYAIWAKARPDSPLAGQSGFLCENRKRMFFDSIGEAEQRIHDIQNLCLNSHPAAEFKCLEYPSDYASELRMHLETIRDLDMRPSFDPNHFEVRQQFYGNTGGGCMVGTVCFHLPELDKPIWVNCNDECVTISSADAIWDEDGSGSWARHEDVLLYQTEFRQKLPDDVTPWLPMIKKALEYTIAKELTYAPAFSLPVAWLPEAFKKGVEPEYLDWLQAEGKKISIAKEGQAWGVRIDESYQDNTPGIGSMERL